MEVLLDAPPSVSVATPSRPHLFTTANAREMSARGNAAKAVAKQRRAEQIAKANGIASLPPDDEYRIKRLMRVRALVDKLDDMMEKERDPQRLDRLASAQARVAKQEQELAGRPLPGSRKPPREKQPKPAPESYGPVE